MRIRILIATADANSPARVLWQEEAPPAWVAYSTTGALASKFHSARRRATWKLLWTRLDSGKASE